LNTRKVLRLHTALLFLPHTGVYFTAFWFPHTAFGFTAHTTTHTPRTHHPTVTRTAVLVHWFTGLHLVTHLHGWVYYRFPRFTCTGLHTTRCTFGSHTFTRFAHRRTTPAQVHARGLRFPVYPHTCTTRTVYARLHTGWFTAFALYIFTVWFTRVGWVYVLPHVSRLRLRDTRLPRSLYVPHVCSYTHVTHAFAFTLHIRTHGLYAHAHAVRAGSHMPVYRLVHARTPHYLPRTHLVCHMGYAHAHALLVGYRYRARFAHGCALYVTVLPAARTTHRLWFGYTAARLLHTLPRTLPVTYRFAAPHHTYTHLPTTTLPAAPPHAFTRNCHPHGFTVWFAFALHFTVLHCVLHWFAFARFTGLVGFTTRLVLRFTVLLRALVLHTHTHTRHTTHTHPTQVGFTQFLHRLHTHSHTFCTHTHTRLHCRFGLTPHTTAWLLPGSGRLLHTYTTRVTLYIWVPHPVFDVWFTHAATHVRFYALYAHTVHLPTHTFTGWFVVYGLRLHTYGCRLRSHFGYPVTHTLHTHVYTRFYTLRLVCGFTHTAHAVRFYGSRTVGSPHTRLHTTVYTRFGSRFTHCTHWFAHARWLRWIHPHARLHTHTHCYTLRVTHTGSPRLVTRYGWLQVGLVHTLGSHTFTRLHTFYSLVYLYLPRFPVYTRTVWFGLTWFTFGLLSLHLFTFGCTVVTHTFTGLRFGFTAVLHAPHRAHAPHCLLRCRFLHCTLFAVTRTPHTVYAPAARACAAARTAAACHPATFACGYLTRLPDVCRVAVALHTRTTFPLLHTRTLHTHTLRTWLVYLHTHTARFSTHLTVYTRLLVYTFCVLDYLVWFTGCVTPLFVWFVCTTPHGWFTHTHVYTLLVYTHWLLVTVTGLGCCCCAFVTCLLL